MIWPIPRLRYRLRTGQWCDHRSYRYSSWLDEVDAAMFRASSTLTNAQVKQQIDAAFPPSPGMDNGRLVDLGRAKLYTCQRCGWATFHPDGRSPSELAWAYLPLPVAIAVFFGLSWLLYWIGVR